VRVDQLTIGATGALAVAISTAAIYLVCVGLLRLLGQRTLTAMSLSDLAGLLATGAVVGGPHCWPHPHSAVNRALATLSRCSDCSGCCDAVGGPGPCSTIRRFCSCATAVAIPSRYAAPG